MTAFVLAMMVLAPAEVPDPPPVIPDPPPVDTLSTVKRVELHRLWYDRHPDGRLDYCHECNKGRVPAPGVKVSREEHEALIRAGATFTPAAPVVAAPTFRRADAYDPDHTCNACGRLVTVVAGWVGSGQHRHVCPCGNSWVH